MSTSIAWVTKSKERTKDGLDRRTDRGNWSFVDVEAKRSAEQKKMALLFGPCWLVNLSRSPCRVSYLHSP
jgi:hypothetical protein